MVTTKILQALGRNAPYVEVLPIPVLANRAPDSNDIIAPGQTWVDQSVSPNILYFSLGNGNFQFGNSTPASESTAGVAEIATQAETNTGTDDTRIVSPLKLKTNLTTPPPIGATTPSTGNFTTLSCAGDLSLTSVATKINMNGGAVTDFIGRATLVAGTVTVANTNIAAGDRILVSRSALNASPALGFPITTISAGASFTIASFSAVGAAAITDVSTFDYVIIRQT